MPNKVSRVPPKSVESYSNRSFSELSGFVAAFGECQAMAGLVARRLPVLH
jgi:hypothetical protein